MEKGLVTCRPLSATDEPSFQALRLFGLEEAPASFASSYEDEKARLSQEFSIMLTHNEDRVVLGAFEGERLIGIAGIRKQEFRKYHHKAALWGVYVHPESRGRGVSRMLIGEAIRFAGRIPGVTQINLTVTGGNAIAIKLYQSLGFQAFGHEPDAIFAGGRLHDEMHMSLRLRAV